jgi:MFS family permease
MSAPAIPRGVWILGLVSLCMDLSSELVHSLLPLFLVTALGASALAVGVVEGVAEATALFVRVFSGAFSDWLGRRKPLAVLGYGLGACAKPLFALALSVSWVLAARVLDRIGKGIRGAPRDALVADLAPAAVRGAAYGLRQSLDTVGAFLGPLLAVFLMLAWAGDFRAVFWFAALPAAAAVLLLVAGVREPMQALRRDRTPNPLRFRALREFGAAFWFAVAAGMVFTLARFSEAFLVLRAHDVGLSAAWAPLVLVAMNAAYALSAYPAGVLADRRSHRALLAAGLAALVAADLALALAGGLAAVFAGVALWGLHMGLTQGLVATMVAATAPAGLRATAFGLHGFASGVATLAASAIAGVLWDRFGAPVTFLGGAAFAAAALAMLAYAPGGAARR